MFIYHVNERNRRKEEFPVLVTMYCKAPCSLIHFGTIVYTLVQAGVDLPTYMFTPRC